MLFLVAQTFFLLLLATALGLFAGWLIWGGVKPQSGAKGSAEPATLASTPTTSSEVTASLTAERDTALADLEARTADVARLRRKLKRAVEELESHADQLEEAEEKIAVLSGSPEAAALLAASGPSAREANDIRDRLSAAESAHAATTADLESMRAEHISVNAKLSDAEAKVQELTGELESLRATPVSTLVDAPETAEIKAELDEARRSAKEATERVTYLEQQALLWQNEADRVQAELEALSSGSDAKSQELAAQLAAAEREHETSIAAVKLDASNARLRADAAAEQLARMQGELRSLQERSAAHLELTRKAMADLDRQLMATHSTLNDANPKSFTAPVADPQPIGLETLPGMTPSALASLHELGVNSLSDVSRWSADDVARMSAWLPETPDIIASNDWVASARALLAGGSVVSNEG